MSARVRRFVLLCAAIVTTCRPVTAAAQVVPGQVDPTFDAGVVASGFGSSQIRAVAVQPDGRILVGGLFDTIGGVTRVGIARLNADGSVDGTFAAPFFVNRRIPVVKTIVVQPDGKILIGGEGFNVGTTDYFLARLMPDGSLDPGFLLIQTNATAGIDVIALMPDGRFYIGGDHGNIGAIQTRTVTRMQADGSVDTSFAIQSLDYSGRALSIVVEPGGSIIAGGNFSGHTLGGGVRFGSLARFSSTGVVDTTFDPGFEANNPPAVESVLRRADGTIYAAGLFRSLHGSPVHGLVRLDPTTGARIAAFDPVVHPTTDDFRAIAFDLEGRLLATGSFLLPGTGPTDERRQIARLNADTGAFDGFYPPNGIEMGGSGYALAVQPDAKVLVAGDFAQLGGVTRARVARLLDVVNTPPVAADDTYTATVNLPLAVPAPGVLSNDSDADGDPLSAVLVAPPANGTLALNADGSFTYTPAPGFAGNDSFTYVAYDGHDTSIAATAHISVLPPLFISGSTGGTIPGGGGVFTGFPGAPVVSGSLSAFVATGSTGLQGVFGCERFQPGDPCRPIVTTSTAMPGGSGLFTGFSSLSTAPGVVAFIGTGASGQLGAFACDTFIPTDPCQPVVSLATPIPGGTGVFGTLSEIAIAGAGPSASSSIAFVGGGSGGQLGVFSCVAFMPGDPCQPIATNATAIPGGTGTFGGFRSLSLALDTARADARPVAAFVGIGAAGQQGVYRCGPGDPCQPIATTTSAIAGGTGTFTGFGQVATGGRFTAFIGTGAGQAGVYSCDLGAPTEPCGPVANLTSPIPGGGGTFTGFSAVSTALGHTAFLAQGANGQAGIYVASVPRKVVAVGDVIQGKTIASLTFGRDGFDGARVAFGARFTDQTEGVFVADVVLPANRAPVAGDDQTSTIEDTAVTLDVTVNDTDVDVEDQLAVGSVTAPAHGSATIDFPHWITYTPAADYSGPDSFTYTVYDGHGGSDTAVVSLSVTPVNDAPVAAIDGYATPEDTILNVIAPGVLLNDGDVDGPSLGAQLVTNAAHGVVNLGASGAFVYTPAPNYNGPDAFTYRATDGTLTSSTVAVSITVAAVNDVPSATGDSYSTPANTPLTVAAPGVLGNDSDADGQALTATLVTAPATGTLVLNANGGFTFTPAANVTGPITFTYAASDGTASSGPATVTISVTDTSTVAAWRLTGRLVATGGGPTGRAGHTATLLPNGKVLVVGGFGTSVDTPRNAQLYDPAAGTWAMTASSGPTLRAGHTATLLANGKVLVAGGFRLGGAATPIDLLDTCLLYDPATATWTPTGSFVSTSGGPASRALHTATLLPNGKVLVVGGVGLNLETPRDAQLYDPATGRWTRAPGTGSSRAGHTATLLADGRVLIAGGLRVFASVPIGFADTAQIYASDTNTWAWTESFRGTAGGPQGRAGHTATLLASGKVLVVGGAGASLDVPRLPQIFDPATGTWSLGALSPVSRVDHTATRLGDGKVLVAGGQNVLAALPLGSVATAHLYDPVANTWSATASLNVARSGHTATLLPNGEVLAVGGVSASGALLDSAERYVR